MSKTAKKKTSKTSSGIAPRKSPVERRRADQSQQAVREVVARAAARLQIPYTHLLHSIAGRLQIIIWMVERIQQDLELSDADVLRLWPLLRRWPR